MIKHAIGIDIGGTNIKGALISEKGEIVKVISRPTEAAAGRKKVLGNIITVIGDILRFADRGFIILGVGIASPGFVNEKGFVFAEGNNINEWNGTDMKTPLEREFGLKIKSDNDGNATALGEFLFGNGVGYKNMICLTLGTGVGGGIIIDGKIYKGSNNCAGELGHIVVDPNGFKCSCGRKGCLEAYASAIGVANIAKKLMKGKKSAKIKDLSPKNIYDLAKKGNATAKKIVKEVGYYLGIGIGTIVNIFAPDVIIIGGGISKNGRILFDSLHPSLYNHCVRFYDGKVKIMPTMFQDYSGVIGAASLVLQDYI